jgi:hypothetical protein
MHGRSPAEKEADYGPFSTQEAAEDWCRREGVATEPPIGPEERWGFIRPLKSP